MVRRVIAVAAFLILFLGVSGPIANASTEWCPFVHYNGKRFGVCIPIP